MVLVMGWCDSTECLVGAGVVIVYVTRLWCLCLLCSVVFCCVLLCCVVLLLLSLVLMLSLSLSCLD